MRFLVCGKVHEVCFEGTDKSSKLRVHLYKWIFDSYLAATPSLTRTPTIASSSSSIDQVRLCVLHQSEYARRRKVQFWKDISHIFEAETGVPIKKPGQTVESLIRQRKEQLTYKSGVAEADTDLKQALDEFMQRFDEINIEEQELLAQKEELAETKARTKAIRHQMMLGRKKSDDGDDDDAETDGDIPSQRSKKRSKLSNSDMISMTMMSSTKILADALTSCMASHTQPPQCDNANQSQNDGAISFDRATELEVQIHQMDKKISGLTHQAQEQMSDLKKQVQEQFSSLNETLAMILHKI
ncbi:hypothetical protein POJ06DRAFT_302443 [Lipomyces tetrasporus]|uniref:Uncharacterized protein n=1 Tax=Lipomyces tetrasporus TaxID=54092 RepID=A0AAD7QNJ9_9ASCO|nr:uncharacterized protein POJ06DRAFT_302443 [Lipomyces tetrasporus]KAJ8098506.1 hypothetical protein POJ06DRAFT_302443 [Lipomyces tetrasporus]